MSIHLVCMGARLVRPLGKPVIMMQLQYRCTLTHEPCVPTMQLHCHFATPSYYPAKLTIIATHSNKPPTN